MTIRPPLGNRDPQRVDQFVPEIPLVGRAPFHQLPSQHFTEHLEIPWPVEKGRSSLPSRFEPDSEEQLVCSGAPIDLFEPSFQAGSEIEKFSDRDELFPRIVPPLWQCLGD